MSRPNRPPMSKRIKSLIRWLSFVSLGVFSFLYFVSFYVWPTYHRALADVPPFSDTVPVHGTEPPTTCEVQVFTRQTFRIEQGVLVFNRTWWSEEPPTFELSDHPEFSFAVAAHYHLQPNVADYGSNYGRGPKISIPFWYFAVPSLVSASFFALPWVVRRLMRAKSSRYWVLISHGLYPLVLVGLIGLPTLLLTASMINSIGSAVASDYFLYLGEASEILGMALAMALILGASAFAMIAFHEYAVRSLRHTNQPDQPRGKLA